MKLFPNLNKIIMKITEKMLLDNYDGISNGGTIISVINGEKIWWNYREGFDGEFNCVCERENAEEILLEYDRYGKIKIDEECENHDNITKIEKDFEKLFGVEI